MSEFGGIYLNALVSPGIKHLHTVCRESEEVRAKIRATDGFRLPLEVLTLLHIIAMLIRYSSCGRSNKVVKQTLFVVS